MGLPVFELTATGIDPRLTTRQLIENNVNAVVASLYGEISAAASGLSAVGSWDASVGTFPSGTAKGDYYIVSVAGTVNGQAFVIGDWLVSLTASASTSVFAANWFRADYSLLDRREFASIAAASASTTLIDGVTYEITSAFNGQKEFVKYVSNSTLTADGALILTTAMATGRLVSTRRVVPDVAALLADIRGLSDGTRVRAGETDFVVSATGHLLGAGSQKYHARPEVPGAYSLETLGCNADGENNRTRIQQALTNLPPRSTILVPPCPHATVWPVEMPSDSSDTKVLTMTQHINLKGTSARSTCQLGFITAGSGVDGLSLEPASEWRGFRMEQIGIWFNGAYGRHGVSIPAGHSAINQSLISDCLMWGTAANSGYAISCLGGASSWKHSVIQNCELQGPIWANWGDRNVIRDNSFLASAFAAIYMDLEDGVYNNEVHSNTGVAKGGFLDVINGNRINVTNNQIEQFPGYGANDSAISASIVLRGTTRPARGVRVEGNNFGGGSNVDYSLYVMNARGTYIGPNQWNAADVTDIHFTAAGGYNYLHPAQQMRRNSYTRPHNGINGLKITPNGMWDHGVPFTLTGENSWSDCAVYKEMDGTLRFIDRPSGGTLTAGTVMYTLPVGGRPIIGAHGVASNSDGSFVISATPATGRIALVDAAPSALDVNMPNTIRNADWDSGWTG